MERKRERRTLLLAIVASILLHFAVAISLASFGDKLQPSLPDDEEKPSELTLVDLAPARPVVNKNAPFIDTPENRQTKEEPKEKTFESNANSIGASELSAAGDAPVPTQQGKDRPTLDLENQQHTLALQGARPQPEVQPGRTPPPSVATPTPVLPQQPSSSYRREQSKTRLQGNISNRGIASVNALGTPLGRYQKMVYDAIGSRWYGLIDQNRDRVNIGTVHVEFVVDRGGRITKLRILENSADESF